MDKAQMAEIYDRLHDAVYRTAFAYLRNRQDAEDITHDVFLQRFAREEPFPDGEQEKAWMLRVTINRCKDLLRSFRRKNSVPLEEAAQIPARTSDERAVWDAVNALPARYRILVHLHYAEGYTLREIAKMTHQTETAVQTQLYRARKRLRAILGEEFTL